MKTGIKIIILLGLLALVATAAFLRESRPEAVSVNPHEADPKAPSSENVSHAVRVEIASLEEQLASSPLDTTSLLRLARLLHDGHQLEKAAVYYERLVEVNPDDRQAWLDLANCYAGMNRWDKAFAATIAHLRIMPGDLQATYNLGAIHANLGEMDEARKQWEDVVARSTDSTLTAMAARSLDRTR